MFTSRFVPFLIIAVPAFFVGCFMYAVLASGFEPQSGLAKIGLGFFSAMIGVVSTGVVVVVAAFTWVMIAKLAFSRDLNRRFIPSADAVIHRIEKADTPEKKKVAKENAKQIVLNSRECKDPLWANTEQEEQLNQLVGSG